MASQAYIRGWLFALLILIPKLELVQDRKSKKPFNPALTLAMEIHNEGIRQNPGIMLYPGVGSADGQAGDNILVAPPYNVTTAELQMILEATNKAISSVFERFKVTGGFVPSLGQTRAML